MRFFFFLAFISIPHLVLAQRDIFDMHVHLWDGEQSYNSYISQLDPTHQHVTRFGGILIASKGEPARTRAKNNELIALSRQHPKLLPICSVHPLDGDSAIYELKRLKSLGVNIIKM